MMLAYSAAPDFHASLAAFKRLNGFSWVTQHRNPSFGDEQIRSAFDLCLPTPGRADNSYGTIQ